MLIHDDFYCVAVVSELEKVVTSLNGETGVKSIGLELQESKSEYFCSDETAEKMAVVFPNFTRAEGGLMVGGIPVGDKDWVLQKVQEKTRETKEEILQTLRDYKDHPGVAYALIRYCISTGWNHWLRAIDVVTLSGENDDFLEKAENEYIGAFIDTLLERIKCNWDWRAMEESHHFLKVASELFHRRQSLGGLGVTSPVRTGPLALLGGYAAMSKSLMDMVTCSVLEKSTYGKSIREYGNKYAALLRKPLDGPYKDMALKDATSNSKGVITAFLDKFAEWNGRPMKNRHTTTYKKMQHDLITVTETHHLKRLIIEKHKSIQKLDSEIQESECDNHRWNSLCNDRNAFIHSVESIHALSGHWLMTSYNKRMDTANGSPQDYAVCFLNRLQVPLRTPVPRRTCSYSRCLKEFHSDKLHALQCSEIDTTQGKTKCFANAIERNAHSNLLTSDGFKNVRYQRDMTGDLLLSDQGLEQRRSGCNTCSRSDTFLEDAEGKRHIDFTARNGLCNDHPRHASSKGKAIMPDDIASIGEDTKLKQYVKYYGKGAKSDTLCIMGFSHNGAWGKLACQNLKKLFKSGPLWKSESRRIQQKLRFVCGISSTIACESARYQLQLIKRAEIRALSDTVDSSSDCPSLSQLTNVTGFGSEVPVGSGSGNVDIDTV